MILMDRTEVGVELCDAFFRYYVLARIVAFGGAVPEKEAAMECCWGVNYGE